ncbi:cytochrome c [Viridibacterium curvum]|uniref:Cytochrome c domain-containing protein n=1 Tax=Viridibacterium curvum TaxID=1101404 RepID=A0ABP9QM73_9RHOO
MNKWIRRGCVSLVVLAAGLTVAVSAAVMYSNVKRERVVEIKPYPLALRDDAQSIERGRYLYASRGCADCHGADGAGRSFINDGNGMHVAGPNISPGAGNVVANYKPADWERTIRHGVKPDGRPLLIMPSEDYNRLTDEDLAALVAYVRHLPPAAGQGAILELPVPVRALYALGVVKDAAERIDHSLPVQQPVAEGVTVEHGAYVVNMCKGCHGEGLSGGKIPGAPPDWPAAANLTPGEGSTMPQYASAETFIAMFRTGKRPDGSTISKVMPFDALGKFSETDMRALHLYLQGVPARAYGGR